MNETPKCPYCGNELRLNENNEGIYWYECKECNATSPTEKTREAAIASALHRAEPEMRPLTPEELRKKFVSDSINPPYVWVEQKRDEDKWLWIVAAVARLESEEVFGRYNQMWRCWPRKPTPEQMAAEKWGE